MKLSYTVSDKYIILECKTGETTLRYDLTKEHITGIHQLRHAIEALIAAATDREMKRIS